MGDGWDVDGPESTARVQPSYRQSNSEFAGELNLQGIARRERWVPYSNQKGTGVRRQPEKKRVVWNGNGNKGRNRIGRVRGASEERT